MMRQSDLGSSISGTALYRVMPIGKTQSRAAMRAWHRLPTGRGWPLLGTGHIRGAA